jgi:hypothetical protein
MDVGAAGLVEKPGNEGLVVIEGLPADRANPPAFAVQTVGTSVNVHEPVGLAHCGEGGGFYPLAVDKPDGANRAGPGHPGFAFQVVVFVLFAPAETKAFVSKAEKQAVPKVEKARADSGKTQNLNI